MDIRSFIAIELSEEIKEKLSALQGELRKSNADVRWVNIDGVHLTLKFLGYVREDKINTIAKAISEVCKGLPPFSMGLKGVGAFPNLRQPRVVWVGVKDSIPLISLQREIEERMFALGFQKEERRFSPHLTIGRIRSLKGVVELAKIIEGVKDKELAAMEVRALALIKSELKPTGAQYTGLAETPLGEGGHNGRKG